MGLCPRYFRSLRDSEVVQAWCRHGRLGRAGSWGTEALPTESESFDGWDLSKALDLWIWIFGHLLFIDQYLGT